MKKSFIVTVNLPDGVTATEMRDYIRVAVNKWRHGGDWETPLYNAKLNVRVQPVSGDNAKPMYAPRKV